MRSSAVPCARRQKSVWCCVDSVPGCDSLVCAKVYGAWSMVRHDSNRGGSGEGVYTGLTPINHSLSLNSCAIVLKSHPQNQMGNFPLSGWSCLETPANEVTHPAQPQSSIRPYTPALPRLNFTSEPASSRYDVHSRKQTVALISL